MSMPVDPQTVSVAAQGAAAVASEAKGLIAKFLGPASEEAGAWLGDHVRLFRLKNQVRILKKATNFLKQGGLEPKAVSLKTLVPLLEAGALEEDTEMANRWASLLASAASPGAEQVVEPSFVAILQQLSPLEARILDTIYSRLSQIPPEEWQQRGIVKNKVGEVLKLRPDQFSVAIDNLIRLRLLTLPSVGLDFIDQKETRFQLSNSDLLCGTSLGQAFINACRVRSVADTSQLHEGRQPAVQHDGGALPVWL